MARGLARELIWRGGVVPEGGPKFSTELGADLLDYGYSLLEMGLRLRDLGGETSVVESALLNAGEAIESTVRNADPEDPARGFHRIAAAAAYHVAHYSARAYCLIPGELDTLNLSPAEETLALLIRRSLTRLRRRCAEWLWGDETQDARVAARLAADEDFGVTEASQIAITTNFIRAIATFSYALESGESDYRAAAVARLLEGISSSAELGHVTLWWTNFLARYLIDDLWEQSLHVQLPAGNGFPPNWTGLRIQFIALLHSNDVAQVELWPSQVEAARRVPDTSDDLVIALPTSAGKTRIAELAMLRTLAEGRRVVYVTPLRALSAQTERILRETFNPLGFTVSSLYGASGATAFDLDTLGNRNIAVATPEKLDFACRNDNTILDDVGLVVLDEGHMLGPTEREIRYEVLVQRLLRRADSSQRRLVCLSAVLPRGQQLDDFTSWLRSDSQGSAVVSDWRPTRQRFGQVVWMGDHARLELMVDSENPFVPRLIEQESIVAGGKEKRFPSNARELTLATAWRLAREGQQVLIYSPTRKSVGPFAKDVLKLGRQGLLGSLLTSEQQIEEAIRIGEEWLGREHTAVQCLKMGLAVHHAQLPRPFLQAIESLIRSRVVRVIVASPTLAQGLNLTASTLLVFSLYRSGERIRAEEFANVAGRAGRAFVDIDGQVLFVLYEEVAWRRRKKLRDWSGLVSETKVRHLESGLLQLVVTMFQHIRRKFGGSPEELIEYVSGSTKCWEYDKTLDDAGISQEQWEEEVSLLDVAILSLAERLEADPAEIPVLLDEVLRGSLWERRLARCSDEMARIASAVLQGRAKWLWSNSTPSQRKGYFFAGLGFSAGRFLDDHGEELTSLLLQADMAVDSGDCSGAARAIVAFAERAFTVSPFRPPELPSSWQNILGGWLEGRAAANLIEDDPEVANAFVQDGLVYRLVWAMEAARVRSIAHDDELAALLTGIAAAAVETGTLNKSAILLLQSGLSSRVAARIVVEECHGAFTSYAEMLRWLRSPVVMRASNEPAWPTPDTAIEWKRYWRSMMAPRTSRWNVHTDKLRVAWESGHAGEEGMPVRLVHDSETRTTHVCSVDLVKLGHLNPPLSHDPMGLTIAKVSGDVHSVQTWRFGPSQ
jgi:hypothetical protein